MGRLSLGRKNSSTVDTQSSALQLPPHCYETRQSPIIVAETTTTRTEVVATSETTHFLSFPGWRKRTHLVHPEPQNPIHSRTSEGSRILATSSTPLSYSREKALPPTPAESPTREPLLLEGSTSTAQCASTATHGWLPRSTSTSILAQAALGLGLPHVMPHASPPTAFPANEVNTVAFVTSTPHQSNNQSIPTLKRSKSSQKVSRPPLGTQLDVNTRERTRGVSLGPTSFLSLGTGDPKGKEKEKVTESHPTTKSVSRRASFWMRKKSVPDGAVQHRPSTAHGDCSRNRYSAEVDLSYSAPLRTQGRELRACDPLLHSASQRPQSYRPPRSHDIPRSTTDHNLLVPRPMTAESPSTTGSSSLWIDDPATGPARVAAISFSEHKTNEKSPNLRLRSQTNPPLLHRLSLNVFSSSSFFSPSPISSPSSPLQSPGVDTARSPVIIPRPMENEESPEAYLCRLEEIINRVEVTSTLASSPEPFYAAALKALIGRFDFNGNSLDIALRKLLMEIGLPKETQQIDRVMEAFANRYMQCNPGLYASEDHPYILAFSLIMLHTDAFNKSNKHKMSKQDYIKNTKLPGVPPEILDYFYDNIIFAPFIFIEDPLDASGQHGLTTESNRRSTTLREVIAMSTNNSSAGPTLAIKSNKIDPYYMITNDLLAPLRIDVEKYIPVTDPFSCQGTAGQWDEEELLLAFANAHVVEVGSDAGRSTPFFGLTAGGSSSHLISTSTGGGDTNHQEMSALRVAKFGVVHRKDDLVEGGKKAGNRKWRSWGVALTGSQLLFSRDPTWINALLSQTSSGTQEVLIPQSAIFKVDEALSVKNAVAVYDRSHTKHRHMFRLALSDSRHLLLKVATEDDMNQWILRINYASAFKSAGVRMRLLGMSGKSMQLTGVAAATSHLHDIQSQIHSPLNEVAKWNDDAPRELLEMLSGDEPANRRPTIQRKVTLKGREEVELELPTPLGAEETTEFKDTFDRVKADLAAETWKDLGDGTVTSEADANPGGSSSLELLSPLSSHSERSRLPSRSQIIQAKITEIEVRLSTIENHLDTHMRLVRNIATLTPFQKATRDRLVVAVRATTQQVMQLRLEIARLQCHRNILHDDMVAENRIWEEVKHIALQTAKETLQNRRTLEAPRMTLSSFDVAHELDSRELETQHQRPESSICESFHTAIDFGPDWPSSDDLGSTFFGTSWLLDSPRPSTSGSLSSYLVLEVDGDSSRIWKTGPGLSAVSQTTSDSTLKGEEEAAGPQHERFYTAQENLSEEAEAWHKTRCAQRVSLVRVPSNIELSQFGRRLTAGQAAPNAGP